MSDKQQPSFWDSVSKKATEVGENIGKKASETGKLMGEKAAETAKKKASEVGEAIAHKTTDLGKTVRDNAKESWETSVHSKAKEKEEKNDWDETDFQKNKDDWSGSNSQEIEKEKEIEEIYHVFVSSEKALAGGTQTVTLRSGKSYDVNIKANTTEGGNLRLRKCGLRGNDAYLVLHTLYNPEINIDRRINNIVVRAPIYDRSRTKCLEAYNNINAGLYVSDLAALDLLDFLISLSNMESAIGIRYTIASENSRWLATDKYVKKALETANLTNSERQWLQITYQYIKLGEPIPNLLAWQQLNSIILNGELSRLLKQRYLLASANAMALRVDMKIVDGIGGSAEIKESDRRQFTSIYHQLRQGKKQPELSKVEKLDPALFKSEIPRVCLTIYKLAQEIFLAVNEDGEYEEKFYQALSKFKKSEGLVKTANNPNTQHIFTDTDVNLNMLANTAYDSVAGGGLGVLGGVKVLKGGEALVAAAGLVAIATTSEMSIQEKVRLGIENSKGFSPPLIYQYFWEEIKSHAWKTGKENIKNLAGLLGVDGFFRNKQEVEAKLKDLEVQLYS